MFGNRPRRGVRPGTKLRDHRRAGAMFMKTAKNHVQRVLDKLELRSRRQLMALASRSALVNPVLATR